MKHFLVVQVCFLIILGNSWSISQVKLPDSNAYDKVVAYEYEGGMSGHQFLIIENEKLASNTSKSIELNDVQVNEILQILQNPLSFENEIVAYCFIPRLGIVYYKKDNVVGHISICLECYKLATSFNKSPTNLSELAKNQLDNFCKELNFLTKPFTTSKE